MPSGKPVVGVLGKPGVDALVFGRRFIGTSLRGWCIWSLNWYTWAESIPIAMMRSYRVCVNTVEET